MIDAIKQFGGRSAQGLKLPRAAAPAGSTRTLSRRLISPVGARFIYSRSRDHFTPIIRIADLCAHKRRDMRERRKEPKLGNMFEPRANEAERAANTWTKVQMLAAYVLRIKRRLPASVSAAVVLISRLGGVTRPLGCVYHVEIPPRRSIHGARPPRPARSRFPAN